MLLRSVLIFLLLAFQAVAEIRVSLNPPNPTVGERAVLKVRLINEKGTLKSFSPAKREAGFKINWNSVNSSQSSSLNPGGKFTSEVSLSWTIEPTGVGQKTIPPIRLVFDNGTRQSKPLKFQVVPAQKNKFYLLETRLNRDNIPLGGVAILDIDICLADQEIRKVESAIGGYELAQNSYDDLDLPKALLDHFHVEVLQGRESNQGTWYGSPAGRRTIDGFPYRVHRIRLELEPKTSGRLEIPAFAIQFYRLGNFKRTWIGRVSASKVGRPIRGEAKPLYLKVSPPPEDGRPPRFTGQVCEKLEVGVSIEDLQPGSTIQLHTPLSLSITLSSDRRGPALKFPDFQNSPNWKDNFDINTSAMQREDKKNSVVFSGIIVRPKNKDLKAIPAIEVPFFSLASESYETASSTEFPVIIETIDDATILDDRAVEVLMVEKEERKKKTVSRLHGLETDPSRLTHSSSRELSWLIVIPLILIPWIAGLGVAWLLPALKQKSKESQSSFHGSYVLGAISDAETPTQMLDLLSKYLLHQFNCKDPSSFTHHNSEVAGELHRLVTELEQAGYGLQTDSGDMAQKTKSMIQNLEAVK